MQLLILQHQLNLSHPSPGGCKKVKMRNKIAMRKPHGFVI
jgi:hypothetical protein